MAHQDTAQHSRVSVASMLGLVGAPSSVQADKVALRWDGGERTYGELKARAESLARSLHERGVRPGQSVIVHLTNRGETIELYFACAYAGVTFVPTNFRFVASELVSVCEDLRPAFVITQERFADEVNKAVDSLAGDIPVMVLGDATSGSDYEAMATGRPLEERVAPHDPHLILFSSGTTGRPKGIAMSHNSILGYSLQWTAAFPAMDQDMHALIVPPLFNAGGINDLLPATFLNGGTVTILPSGNWSAAGMADSTHRNGVTHAVWFPTMLRPILEAGDEVIARFAGMRSIIVGGEHCTAALLAELRAAFPNASVINTYGLTEGGLVTLLPHNDFEAHPDSVGRVSPGGQGLEIRGVDGSRAPVGTVGEIWTTAPFLPEGYWNAPDMDAESHVDGWLKTGDLGRVDVDGYLYIEGRSRDVIISKGQNVYPAEIESALMTIPGVAECAVVGLPDEEFGESPCAVIVLKAGVTLTEEMVTSELSSRIAAYKRPRRIVFRNSLPISDANKVLKRRLVEVLTQEFGLTPKS